MRGKGRVRHAVHRFVGITPACAGKRCQLVHAYDDGWDHPRVCGEKSSRGRDYPRVCGEKVEEHDAAFLARGSPPRMRGKAIAQTSSCRRTGITPAYAGKSRLCYVLGCFCKDHPRVCGEKKVMRGAKDKRMGSPPHVRGKAQDLTDRQPVCWITPACAGKRRCKAAFCAWFWDHPRMCGEKASHSATLFGVGGSPPHVRGKVGRTLYLVAGERITPAYAGKSFLQRTAQCRCQDHPRVCGEKTKKIP